MALLFDTMDTTAKGAIGIGKLGTLVRKETTDFLEASAVTQDIVGGIIAANGGETRLSKDVFKRALQRKPVLYEVLSKSVIPDLPNPQAKADVDRIASVPGSPNKMDLTTLKSLWRKYSHTSGSGHREVSLPMFRRFCQEHFGVGLEMMPIVNRVYTSFDRDGDGRVGWSELFLGLASATGGSVDAKAEFYFSL